jgi:glutamine synthetase
MKLFSVATAMFLMVNNAAPVTAFVVPTSTSHHFANTRPTTSTTSLSVILETTTGQSQLDPIVLDRYANLPYPKDLILVEYVWVDAVGNTRSKTRTLPARKGQSVETLPQWNFDGSSTGQAPGDDSEVILKPRRIFRDPFRPRVDGVDNILVMCDTYNAQGEALPTNTRAIAMKAFVGHEDEEPWFGLEQEFTLFNLDQRTPLGWPEYGMPSRPQGYVALFRFCFLCFFFLHLLVYVLLGFLFQSYLAHTPP